MPRKEHFAACVCLESDISQLACVQKLSFLSEGTSSKTLGVSATFVGNNCASIFSHHNRVAKFQNWNCSLDLRVDILSTVVPETWACGDENGGAIVKLVLSGCRSRSSSASKRFVYRK